MENRISSCHLKRQRQILASGGGENLSVPAKMPPVMDCLESAPDNLALATTNDKAVVEQLTAANLALTSTIATPTATNKKFENKA